LSQNHTPNTTRSPATTPMMIAPVASTTSQGAVIATRPASEAFKHIDTSGLPYLSHVNIIHTTVAIAGAIVVAIKIDASCGPVVAAAPLNPYHPNQRMKHPSAPITMLCPGNACTFVTFPSLSLVNLPILAPSSAAPINAVVPPTMWIAQEPAKSWNPKLASHPPPQIQCASIGYTTAEITAE